MKVLRMLVILATIGHMSLAHAVNIVEMDDFSDNRTSATIIGALDPGANIIIGSISTTCVATNEAFPDCSGGDDIDNIGFSLAPGQSIVSATAQITNLVETPLGAGLNLPAGRFTGDNFFAPVTFFGDDGQVSLPGENFLTRVLIGAVGSIQTQPNQLQGIGPISFNYEIRLDVAPVPLPAAAWLFMSAIAGLFGVKRMRHAPAVR